MNLTTMIQTVGQVSDLPVLGVSDSLRTGLQSRPEPSGQRPDPRGHMKMNLTTMIPTVGQVSDLPVLGVSDSQNAL
jgi:hypothetical protein